MMAPPGFRPQLEALQLIYVLAERGIPVVVATATHDMGPMMRLMMEGRPGGVRFRQVVRVGARDNCMRGDGAPAEAWALDRGRVGVGHSANGHSLRGYFVNRWGLVGAR